MPAPARAAAVAVAFGFVQFEDLQAVQEPCHARGGEEQHAGKVHSPHPALVGPGEVEQRLVVVDRQTVLELELRAHGAGRGGVAPYEPDPGLER